MVGFILLLIFVFWYLPGLVSILIFLDYNNITKMDIIFSILVGFGGWYSVYKIHYIYNEKNKTLEKMKNNK